MPKRITVNTTIIIIIDKIRINPPGFLAKLTTFIVAKRRFQEQVDDPANLMVDGRPNEGDVIYQLEPSEKNNVFLDYQLERVVN